MDPSLREQLLGIFAETNSIAVVGASVDSSKPAHQIPRYLQRQGYRIPPVNPRGGELLGEAVARSLAELIPRADGRLVSVEEYEALIEA
jgi:predicted CoA-binding protein